MSPELRELISRSVALAVGVGLIYLAIGCFWWGEGLRADTSVRERSTQEQVELHQPLPSPRLFPYVLMLAFGAVGAAMTGFAVLPTRVLYSLNPSPSEASGSDIGTGFLETLRY